MELTLSLFPEAAPAAKPKKEPVITFRDDDEEIKRYAESLKGPALRCDLRSILGNAFTREGASFILDRSYTRFTQQNVLSYTQYNDPGRSAAVCRFQTASNGKGTTLPLNLFYVTRNAVVWCVPVNVTFIRNGHYFGSEYNHTVSTIDIGKPFQNKKMMPNPWTCQTTRDILNIFQLKKPYLHTWLAALHDDELINYLNCPWSETLSKAGYAVAHDILKGLLNAPSDLELVNRLLQRGNNPKEIFKTSKSVYSALKEETSIHKWDVFRRMEKNGRISGDTISIVYAQNWDKRELETANSILGYEDESGKKVFSWTTLTNYLNRLDMYEALSAREALPILADYLHMCRLLRMTPRTDGDSLKREHDVAARLCRERHDEILAAAMARKAETDRKEILEGNTRLARCDYSEKVYFIRAIRDYDELVDEARQQHNCVASYADRIAKGQSRIFTMRETANPDKSLITIELSPDLKTIRQKYLAYNQSIHNRSQSEFIERWIRQVNA